MRRSIDMDAEMTEAAAAEAPPQETVASISGENDVVRDLLTLAGQFVNQGKPSQALQAVIFLSLSFFLFLSILFI